MKKYLSVEEYLMGRITYDKLTIEQQKNINTLIPKINTLLEQYARPWVLNSGFRTKEDQMRINPKAPNSKHCEAAAVDLGDKDHLLRYWVLSHINVLEILGLYMEDPSHCPTWCHLQIIPPKSGYRIFLP